MGVRQALATGAGRAVRWGLATVLHRNASQLPGRVALAIDPDVIADLAHKVQRGSVVVCGTNGKTTTNNVVAAAVEATGASVLCNRYGANMAAGVASALLPGSKADYAVIEADELSTIHILPQLRPRYLVLLNLFRDQLDRAGEMDHVQDTIVAALAASPETALVYCGDDPLSAEVARRAGLAGTRTIAFGIGEDLHHAPDRVRGGRFCPVCGAELAYDYHTYAQLGSYRCPTGDFSRPQLALTATAVRAEASGIAFDLSGLDVGGRLSASFGGTYMVYNLLAAFAAAHLLAGCDLACFQRVLDGYHPENGRLQHFDVGGREVVLNLAKNPTGLNQNITLMEEDERRKAVLVLVNDHPNDGTDISWIWDVDFERLAGAEGMRVFAGGTRANDLQVRLKYAGVEAPTASTIAEVLGRLGGEGTAMPLYVLANYSALFPAKAELERLGERR